MDWLPYAIGGAVALAVADLSIKLASGRVSGQLGAVIYSLSGLPVMVAWTLVARSQGTAMRVTPLGLLAALCAGVAFAFVVIFLYQTFATGADISVAVPLIRMSGIVLSSALGIVVFREPVTVRYVVGLVLAGGGIYLLATR